MAEKCFSIGDLIVYGSVGVTRVVDIREESIMDTPREYYVLCDVTVGGESRIFVPCDNERLVATMRPLLSPAEAQRILDIPEDDLPDVEWRRDSRARLEHFRSIIESGDHVMIRAMIASIRRRGDERRREGKKNFLSDESILQKAEHLLNTELDYALGRRTAEAD